MRIALALALVKHSSFTQLPSENCITKQLIHTLLNANNKLETILATFPAPLSLRLSFPSAFAIAGRPHTNLIDIP